MNSQPAFPGLCSIKLFHTRSVASQFQGRKALNSLGWLSCCFAYTSLHTDVDPRTLFETILDLVRQTQPWRVEVFSVLRPRRYHFPPARRVHEDGRADALCGLGTRPSGSCFRPRPSWRLESLKKQILLMPVSTIFW